MCLCINVTKKNKNPVKMLEGIMHSDVFMVTVSSRVFFELLKLNKLFPLFSKLGAGWGKAMNPRLKQCLCF